MSAIPLSNAALPLLMPQVQVPAQRPDAAGIVHLGLGGFHRAHMARYTHDVVQSRPDMRGWGIVGAGLMPNDRLMRDSLVPQDCLYTLVERAGDAESVTVIGSLVDVLFAAEDSAVLLDAIDRPGIRIVSLTVTENGYCLDRATKRLDPNHPLIRRDLAQPEHPASGVGIIVEACRRRMAAGAAPFTALSCDNIQHNGRVLHDAVVALAMLRDPVLAAWIGANITFPNTMVDRITPVTSDHDRAALAKRYNIADRWPVVSERFSQWVIEDRFVAGRPAWEDVGVQFVDDVAPYEFMKLWLLNASHLAVAGLGRLMGYHTIDEAMGDPLLVRYMAALMERETGPTLPAVPGIDLPAYKATLIERFANPAIKDTVERVNTDAPLNVLLDPIRDRLDRGQSIGLLALALAAWLRRVRGVDEQGQAIEIRHPLAAELRARAEQVGADPGPLLALTTLFGTLGKSAALHRPVARWLAALDRDGSRTTLAEAAHELSF